MSRQTAMQEMHEWLADKWSDPGKMLSCYDVCMKIEELLPIEKRQIIDAWVNGNDNEPKETTEHFAEQYYNQTYKGGENV
jgi:hypothetical protein